MMHGPYKKRVGDQIIEEGIFYYGLKHDRWLRYNSSDILQNKEFFSLVFTTNPLGFFGIQKKKSLKKLFQKDLERSRVYITPSTTTVRLQQEESTLLITQLVPGLNFIAQVKRKERLNLLIQI